MSRFVTTLAALGMAGGVAFAAAGPASAAPAGGHGGGGDVFQSCVKEQNSLGVLALNLDLLTQCIANNNWH